MKKPRYCGIDAGATGKRIKAAMERRRITAAELAPLLGLNSPTALYYWFNGKSLPSVENFYRLAEVLDCRIGDLIIGIEADGE